MTNETTQNPDVAQGKVHGKETYNQEEKDALSRWWWPGQWLRIVWSVWVDQEWYWSNVRPRLVGHRHGWGLFIQSLLGAMIVLLLSLLFLVGAVQAIGDHVQWQTLLGLGINSLAMIGLCVIIALIGGFDKAIPANSVLVSSFVVGKFIQNQYLSEGLLSVSFVQPEAELLFSART